MKQVSLRLPEFAPSMANFIVIEDNLSVLAAVTEWLVGSIPQLMLLGKPGCGRTHLLTAAAHSLPSDSVCLIDWRGHINQLELQLDSEYSYWCWDNIDAAATDQKLCELMFFHYNQIRQQQNSLLLSSQQSPSRWAIDFPDLISRLNWGLTLTIQVLPDAERIKAMQLWSARRGMVLPKDVAQFIYQRSERSINRLWQVIDQLDRSSLSEHRRLTIPYVKKILHL